MATRQMSAAGFSFKGSGFYLTDYGKNAHRGSAPEKKGDEGSKSDVKADAKTDSKADTKADTKADIKADTKADRKADTKAESKPKPASKPKPTTE
jgi:predicted nucleic acid-binding Zn ribbon protein